jgi:hypothetical protein
MRIKPEKMFEKGVTEFRIFKTSMFYAMFILYIPPFA